MLWTPNAMTLLSWNRQEAARTVITQSDILKWCLIDYFMITVIHDISFRAKMTQVSSSHYITFRPSCVTISNSPAKCHINVILHDIYRKKWTWAQCKCCKFVGYLTIYVARRFWVVVCEFSLRNSNSRIRLTYCNISYMFWVVHTNYATQRSFGWSLGH